MRNVASFVALNRFGLGAAPGDPERVESDPRGWLARQVAPERETPAAFRSLPGSATIIAELHEARLAGPEALRQAVRDHTRNSFVPSVLARARQLVTTEQPFVERMVLFWSNHFTVSRSRAVLGPIVPAYEREAIRPHVFGRFEDLLLAATRHPAMLTYLDNISSIGPNSLAGRRRKVTLNENLAREILELHTLGVNGGYAQRDIVEFAKTLTGWTHGGARGRRDPRPGHGNFEFEARIHEPGPKTVLGRTYREDGVREAEAVLRDLAHHPSTATFIATKLVRHFVADDPPADAVGAIAAVYRNSSGDLARVSRALVDLEAAWRDPLAKVKTHHELVISALRATGVTAPNAGALLAPLHTMGQTPFSAPSPAGWADHAKSWIAPEALMRRIEWIRALSARLPATLRPAEMLERTIGPVASGATRRMVELAPSVDAGLALLFASAEFQRR